MPGNGKYTEELANQIADLVGQGVPVRHASEACGVHFTTFYNWLETHATLSTEIKKRRSQAVAERVALIQKAATEGKQWTAAAWYLERQHPEEFGVKPERRDINITVEIRDCTADTGQVEQKQEPKCIPYIDVDVDAVD